MTQSQHDTGRSIRRSLTFGIATTLFLTIGVGGLAMTTELAGAVIAPGSLVVDSSVKKVQHPTGGVVGDLRVRNGDTVQAGELLLRLDETVTRANLSVVEKALVEAAARRARNEAERDDADQISFPSDLLARRGDPEIAAVLGGEERLFVLRRMAREGQKAQLKERIGQLQEEIRGLLDQIQAKGAEIALIGQELKGVRDLWKKNLVPITRVTALERDAARLEGERGGLIAAIAQAKGKISETELQIIQIDQDLRTEVGKELAEIRAKMSELVEKRVAAEDELKRIDIRAPQGGVVHELAVHTAGEVVPSGEPIMLIVPKNDMLTVEVKVGPQDIDQIRLGQRAVLRFSAFNQRTTPELNGEVSRIAADVSEDTKTGATFYTVRVALPDSEIVRLKELKLLPGMPVESFIQTGERTVMSYLIKPLHDQLTRAWREN